MHPNIYWHCLKKTPGLGHSGLHILAEHFTDGEAAWNAGARAYVDAGITSELIRKIEGTKRSTSPEEEAELLAESGINVIIATEPTFPKILSEIPQTPFLLYARGTIDDWNARKYIAVVGSRRITSYGRQATEHIASDLARAGFTVVSGLAFGIDKIAHEAALRSGHETVAVLGDSLDDASIAPQSHLALAQEITSNGSLLSEYPPVTAAMPGFFPARNRIVAGLSLGTVVIEAAERSGALITANLALDYDREVFAVPGSIFSPASVGTNTLIKSGAKIVRSIGDIIEEFPAAAVTLPLFDEAAPDMPKSLTPDEQKVFTVISHEPTAVDGIIKLSHLGTSAASGALTMLEIKGLIKDIGGNHYIRMQIPKSLPAGRQITIRQLADQIKLNTENPNRSIIPNESSSGEI
jgi:DNA processing protein